MVDKVNGTVASGQFLTKGLDTYVLRTSLDIRPTGVISDESQSRLDKIVEVISTRAQPIILGSVAVTAEASPADLPGATGGSVYTLRFSIEHLGAWEIENSDPSLAESLNGVAGLVYDVADTSDNNVAVVLSETLA